MGPPVPVKSVLTPGHLGPAAESRGTTSVTALQDWLSFRPVDQRAIRELVCRPLRAVWSNPNSRERTEFTVMGAGIERC